MSDADDLLVGPRGRRLCLEFAMALARDAASPAAEEFLRAVFFAAHDLDSGRGTSRVMLTMTGQEALTRLRPSLASDNVARLLGAVPLERVDDLLLMDSLAAAVDNARYWQEADGEDVLAAAADVRGALARVAASIASSDAAAWWPLPLDRTAQWSVVFDDEGSPTPSVSGTAAEHLARWRLDSEQSEIRARRERPSDPRANFSGAWWSTPPRELTRTTRSLGVAGPLGLQLVEDAFGWDRATVRPVEVPGDANVYEVDGPESWAQLCRRYPLDVTASRRHDWFRTTGAADAWVVPDWSRAAEDFDAIHLTVAGYLQTAGRAVAVTDDASCVLAGWNPDETYWLTDVALAPRAEREWVRRDDGTWRERQF